MIKFKKLSHVNYRFTYHIVWTSKYRFRNLEGLVKELLLKDIQMLLEWKSCELVELKNPPSKKVDSLIIQKFIS